MDRNPRPACSGISGRHGPEYAIQTTVLIGTAANGCVDATARDAAQLDYDVVIARDLTGYSDATLAASALQNLDRHFALVCQSSEILSQMA